MCSLSSLPPKQRARYRQLVSLELEALSITAWYGAVIANCIRWWRTLVYGVRL